VVSLVQLQRYEASSKTGDQPRKANKKASLKMALFTFLTLQPALLAIGDSDVGHRAEELVIFGISTFTFVDGLDVFDKLNGLYPLHHFEPEFIFRAQP
jgi:hypothetical protein